jgi:hypothetical protein
MSEKDILLLIELAEKKLAEVKSMSKMEAILSLNEAGILTKKGKLMSAYAELEKETASQ